MSIFASDCDGHGGEVGIEGGTLEVVWEGMEKEAKTEAREGV